MLFICTFTRLVKLLFVKIISQTRGMGLGRSQFPEYMSRCLLVLYLELILIFICGCTIHNAMCGLSLVAVNRGYSLLWCSGFSLWWLLLLQSTGSRPMSFSSCSMWVSSCSFWALEHRINSCGTQA